MLWNPYRDCNPFLHLIEALWVLSGSNNCRPIAHFAKRMLEFSDEDLTTDKIPSKGKLDRMMIGNACTGGLWWGAYGYRYRHWFETDQLQDAIKILRDDPKTRRVVIQAWEPRDLRRVVEVPDCKDVPCNTEIMFRTRPGPQERLLLSQHSPPKERAAGGQDDLNVHTHKTLDMTVINRSNDLLWGALGSNYVTFSVLHEYIALSAGYAIGNYNQISNNLHVYSGATTAATEESREKNGKPPADLWSGKWVPGKLTTNYFDQYSDRYNHLALFPAPFAEPATLEKNRSEFINDCESLFRQPLNDNDRLNESFRPENHFFQDVVLPMILSYNLYKKKEFKLAEIIINRCYAPDWRQACLSWLKRRQVKHERITDDGLRVHT